MSNYLDVKISIEQLGQISIEDADPNPFAILFYNGEAIVNPFTRIGYSPNPGYFGAFAGVTAYLNSPSDVPHFNDRVYWSQYYMAGAVVGVISDDQLSAEGHALTGISLSYYQIYNYTDGSNDIVPPLLGQGYYVVSD